MAAHNPYAPPQAGKPNDPGPWYPGRTTFLAYVSGNQLVVEKEAPLPDVCMKCGAEHAPHRRKQQFIYTPPWVIMLMVLSALIGVIVAMIVRKTGTLHLPLCNDCHKRWKMAVLFTVLAVLWLIAGLVLTGIAAANDMGVLAAFFGLTAFGVLIWVGVSFRNAVVRSVKVDDRVIHLVGVHPGASDAIVAAAEGR